MNAVFLIVASSMSLVALGFLAISSMRKNQMEPKVRERVPSHVLEALEPRWFQRLHSGLMISFVVLFAIPCFYEAVSTRKALVAGFVAISLLHGWFFFRTRSIRRKFSDQIPSGSRVVFEWAEIEHGGFMVLAGIAGLSPLFLLD